MLPLRLDALHSKKKKRKSSSIDFSMWNESPRVTPSAASGAALTRNRAFLLLLVLGVFMVISLSSSSLLQSTGGSVAASQFRVPAADTAAVVTRGDHQVVTFADANVVTPRPNVRRGDGADVTATPPPRPDSFAFVVVADLDKKSKDSGNKRPTFYSFLQHGTLKINPRSGGQEDYSVVWGQNQRFTTTMNEAGRGFELSELAWFNSKLLTFDDRTGIVYQLKQFEHAGAKPVQAIPTHIIMEGDGVAGKGQKHEWATSKDGELYMGSVGKEFTDNDGNILSDSNLWVAVLDKHGEVRHEDWSGNFARVRKALDCEYPGYVIHEAIEWSAVHRKWFLLPRRVSKEAYNDQLDETRGSNKLVLASEDFSTIEVFEVGRVTPLRGFSSFKFVPRTDDSVIIAVKSVEIDAEQSQTSFVTVFDIRGNVLLDETELPGGYKYEGIAFAHDW